MTSTILDLISAAKQNTPLAPAAYQEVFDSQHSLFALLDAAYQIRKMHFGNKVQVHIINNVQNGLCPENCKYCAQAVDSEAPIEKYRMKSEEEILAEARNAYESGAFRYCMVASGRGPSEKQIQFYSQIIKKIKSEFPIQVCLSSGLMGKSATDQLKAAGLDRLNHNLNTAAENYAEICSTHTYQDRVNTLEAGAASGLELCSGVIVGMGESDTDLINLAFQIRKLGIVSIPVNFFLPIEGTQLQPNQTTTPERCLRILALFRLINPKAEIRVAAGREFHFRSLQPLAFFAANSLFLDGYLNAKGSSSRDTLAMLKDAGFEIDSRFSIDDLSSDEQDQIPQTAYDIKIKSKEDLRPEFANTSL